MKCIAATQKDTIVLAIVKGEVHDIGKNLVDIIMTNNGYRVINVEIKQPIAAILAAAREHAADAVGMWVRSWSSPLLSCVRTLKMSHQDFNIPVLLGGAALTCRFVGEDCTAITIVV